MKTRFFVLVTILGLVWACSKDDGPSPPNPDAIDQPDPDSENRPPGSFTLLEVEDGVTGVDLLPTFTWSTATDPDGDTVSYDVFFGSGPDSINQVATGLNTTSFTLSDKLDMVREYQWKVMAKDGKGGATASAEFSFTTRPARVTRVQTTNPFAERHRHTSVVYQDQMWILGGTTTPTGIEKNDVWASEDGSEWVEIKRNTTGSYDHRSRHASIVFNDRMYVLGGIDEDDKKRDDVWYSVDGVEWTEEKDAFGLSGLSGHGLEVFKESMWVIGGRVDSGNIAAVRSSSTGIGWFDLFPGNRFTPRSEQATVVFDDKLWVIGGTTGSGMNSVLVNDVWQSEDGNNWTIVTENADFSARRSLKVVVFDDKMWVIGGADGTVTGPTEIWYSSDGKIG